MTQPDNTAPWLNVINRRTISWVINSHAAHQVISGKQLPALKCQQSAAAVLHATLPERIINIAHRQVQPNVGTAARHRGRR